MEFLFQLAMLNLYVLNVRHMYYLYLPFRSYRIDLYGFNKLYLSFGQSTNSAFVPFFFYNPL